MKELHPHQNGGLINEAKNITPKDTVIKSKETVSGHIPEKNQALNNPATPPKSNASLMFVRVLGVIN